MVRASTLGMHFLRGSGACREINDTNVVRGPGALNSWTGPTPRSNPMKPSGLLLAWCAGLMATLISGSAPATAQTYPNRPIRLIVPFAPGGLNDTVARLMQPHLEK